MQAIQLTAVVAGWTLAVLAAFAVAGKSLIERGSSDGSRAALHTLAVLFFIGLWLVGAAAAFGSAGGMGLSVFAVASWLSILVLPRLFTDGETVRRGPLLGTLATTLAIALAAGWAVVGKG